MSFIWVATVLHRGRDCLSEGLRLPKRGSRKQVGWASMAPALFHTGDFLSMFDYMDKILA